MRNNKKPIEALLIMHIGSLDNYTDMFGPQEAHGLADRIIDEMLLHNGPVIVVDELWEVGTLDTEPREEIYNRAIFPMVESGRIILIAHNEAWESDFSEHGKPLAEEECGYSGYWEEFFQELLPVLNELDVDRVRIGGFWYEPEHNSGCAFYAGQWLSRAFDIVYDENILGSYRRRTE